MESRREKKMGEGKIRGERGGRDRETVREEREWLLRRRERERKKKENDKDRQATEEGKRERE